MLSTTFQNLSQLLLFNAYHDELRWFLPIHVHDTKRARPVIVILRPGKTPSGLEIRGHLRRRMRRIQRRCPPQITYHRDSSCTCPEVMAWREATGTSFIFGLADAKSVGKKVEGAAYAIRAERAIQDWEVVHGFAETKHQAGSWSGSK